MKPQLQFRTSQSTAMTPQLLQSIRLLQLSALELEQELREALERNVLLQQDDLDDSGETEEVPAPVADEGASSSDAELPVSGQDPAAVTQVEADFDWSSADSWSGGEPLDDDERPWQERCAAPETVDIRLRALEQLQLIISDAREARIAEALLEAIDDSGYLEQPLDGIVLHLGAAFGATLDEVEAVLAKLQSVEPTGFAARSLAECLALQLRALPAATPGRRLAERLVATALERIAARDFAGLQHDFNVSAAALAEGVALIRTLHPKPAAALAAPAEAVLPDLIVSGAPGAWRVELNAERLPRLRVNKLYERLLAGSSHKGLRDQLQEARWLVRGLEIRHQTLLRTGQAVFERQQRFLERGEEGMAPLTLREIAEAIGMHESTVCRVTSNKWVMTPWGVYDFKAFFPSQITGTGGNETSGTAVKAMIRRMIDGENRAAPLCDGDIAALLARRGIRVARRTVAKYREAMKIPPAKERLRAPQTAQA